MNLPLTGPSIELRPFTLDDVAAMHEVYRDPRVMRWVGYGPVTSLGGTESMIRQYMAHQRAHGFGFWAVVERESGAVIGDAGLARTAHGLVEMGYTLSQAWWGRGFATQAAELTVGAARHQLGFSQIRALVEAPNVASRRVLEKVGFVRSGVTVAFDREHLVYRVALR